MPTSEELLKLQADLEWALEAAERLTRVVAGLTAPTFEADYEFVALHHESEYALNEGRVISNRGLDISVSEYEDHFLEQHVRHSNALHSQLRERGSYLTGPLARFNLNYEQLPERARRMAREVGLEPPVRNPFLSIVVRMIETVFACEEALDCVLRYQPPGEAEPAIQARAGVGQAITEAPRGMLYHRYSINSEGLIEHCRIVPPTSQNLRRIEDDLWKLVPECVSLPAEELTRRCEQAVRNYDPCISCATHFLKVKLERE